MISNKLNSKKETVKTPKEKKNGKKLLLAGATAVAAIGIATVLMVKKGNFNKVKNAFEDLINNAQKGNNNILSSAIQEENEAVEKFIQKNPEGWEDVKKYISSLIDVKNADEILEDGTLYHGTSVKSAKNILSQGVTPFSEKRTGSGSGMGYGFYSTPDLKAAEFYSEHGVILPFKLKGNVATLKENVEPDDIKTNIMAIVMRIIDPIPDDLGIMQKMFYMPSEVAQNFARDNQSLLVTKAMQELGIDAIYTKGATSRGGILGSVLNNAPEFLDEAGQITVFNGNSIEFLAEKAKELNPITPENYKKFI